MKLKNSCNMMLALLLICVWLTAHFTYGADTISGNQSLSGYQTLISSGGNFELGFFRPGNSSNYYIGIWYMKVSDRTVVWVANRVAPVSDRFSSSLRIQGNNLVLLNESEFPVWSTNISSRSSSPLMAILLDDGNFVLSDGSTPPLWQSLDNPTHTWLPGGKLSYNKITRTAQRLTSWKNSENPAPGLFNLELVPEGRNYIIKWNGTRQYWDSGPWNGRIFSDVPEMKLNYAYNFSYIDSENESYCTYSVYDPSVVFRFILDFTGQIKLPTWLNNSKQWNMFWAQPRRQCTVYAYCGAFGICNENSLPSCNCLEGFEIRWEQDWNLNDFSGGCVRRTRLRCESNSNPNVAQDRFWEQNQMRLPEGSQSLAVGSSAECESACLGNCSCTAYAFDSNGCSIWHGELLNLHQLSAGDGNPRTINIRLAASEFSSAKNNQGIVIGAAVGSVAVVLIVAGFIFFVIWKRKRGKVGTGKAAEGSLVAFGYKDLQNVTKNFSEKLGGGGFGSVFKGSLPDSSVIAVKKLESIGQGEKQFRTEVSTIGTIQHVNLVRLRGFCSDGNKKLLVYDYMVNGSLDVQLFHEKEAKVLDWKTRYQIALGTARGLAYLHQECWDCIIHCDIKPENILLDADFCPKLADFGLAKLLGRDFSRVLTTMRGTRGYLAPEWLSGVAITAKADVYSYGMMLFEIISGTRNSEHSIDGVRKFFPTWAARLIADGGNVLRLVDPKLNGMVDAEELSRLSKVACWCVQDDENDRPSMGQVVQILEGIFDPNLPPVPRSLQFFVENQEHIVFFTESESKQSSQIESSTSSSLKSSSITSSGGLES